ncbi:SDR family oxidoreductase [Burkholderia anthina]|uniref:SDR family NAD(P)-dependent oxidoreductase n=1 Tax=Burkholderia anthina TaxID=179879 RepID=UPI001CF1DA03|nr:SDR family oxidoreductase [Burkholderia anthina]MCA8094862.1 SDR family oxidoreductase [Burkholderia anthina]
MGIEQDWQTRNYLPEMRQDGKGYVVLGVGSGIGGEVCRAFREAGAELVCVDIKDEVAQRAAAAVQGTPVTGDVTRREDMERVFAVAKEQFGSRFAGVIDVVGITLPSEITELDDTKIGAQFDLVFRHALLAMQLSAPLLAENGGGNIIVVGSLAGLRSTKRAALYGAAKAALHHLVMYASDEFGPSGVRVNGVAPGRIAASGTHQSSVEMIAKIERAIPLRRMGVPSEIAGVALFLASGLASYVTGNIIVADGGIRHVSALPSTLSALAAAA